MVRFYGTEDMVKYRWDDEVPCTVEPYHWPGWYGCVDFQDRHLLLWEVQ
jgi:hypothetical protein